MGKNIPKDVKVMDVSTGEELTNDALAERMRMILAKQMEVADAEALVPPAEEAVDAAKESLSDARAKVQAVRAEVFDIIRGQSLLF